MELINLTNVSYAYSDGTLALNNINLTINKGEKVAILGPNGAGKSTLFQLFNGLLKPQRVLFLLKVWKLLKRIYLKFVVMWEWYFKIPMTNYLILQFIRKLLMDL